MPRTGHTFLRMLTDAMEFAREGNAAEGYTAVLAGLHCAEKAETAMEA